MSACPVVHGFCPVPLRAILKELGLQGKVSTYQMAKKWDNLKRRYKVRPAWSQNSMSVRH